MKVKIKHISYVNNEPRFKVGDTLELILDPTVTAIVCAVIYFNNTTPHISKLYDDDQDLDVAIAFNITNVFKSIPSDMETERVAYICRPNILSYKKYLRLRNDKVRLKRQS